MMRKSRRRARLRGSLENATLAAATLTGASLLYLGHGDGGGPTACEGCDRLVPVSAPSHLLEERLAYQVAGPASEGFSPTGFPFSIVNRGMVRFDRDGDGNVRVSGTSLVILPSGVVRGEADRQMIQGLVNLLHLPPCSIQKAGPSRIRGKTIPGSTKTEIAACNHQKAARDRVRVVLEGTLSRMPVPAEPAEPAPAVRVEPQKRKPEEQPIEYDQR